jgi:arsenate reductase
VDLLRERDVEFDIIEYLKSPISGDVLGNILDALGASGAAAGELVRKDKNFKELGLDETKYSDAADRQDVIALLLENPKLMQRPIALRDGHAIIGRPADLVLQVLED